MSRNKHLDDFMKSFPHEGLTFDDITLVTQFADFLPNDTDLSSKFSSRIAVNIPFVSAAMDTVTEARMAIAMAMLGGIGIIHRNLTPEQQANIVRTVKHHLNGLIEHPVTFRVTDTLKTVDEVRREKGYAFSGFPILDAGNAVVGILTAADIKFARNPDVPISSVMTAQVITAPKGTTLQQAYDIMQKNKIGKLPLVENGKLVGLYSFSDVQTLIQNVEPMFNRDAQYRLRVGAAIAPHDEERVAILAKNQIDVVVVDTSHGHSQGVLDITKWVKKNYPEIDVVAGNIATGEAAVALRDAGADAVKVGIGPGSICTTRVITGVGVPLIIWPLTFFILNRSRFGKQLYLVGNNPVAARLSGIKVNQIKIISYVMSGMLAAFAGMLGAAYMSTARCQIFDDYAYDSLIAVIIGGTAFSGGIGSYEGSIAGSLVMILLSNLLTTLQLTQPIRNVTQGVIMILLLMLYNRSKSVRQ